MSKLNAAEQKRLEDIRRQGDDLNEFTAINAVHFLIPIVDRLANVPSCDGCVRQADKFRTKCPNCVRYEDERQDRYEKKDDENGDV